MSTLAIELNDSGLNALGRDPSAGAAGPVSPGYALVGGASLLTGSEAARRARLEPRRIHYRFWSELDTTPLGRPFPAELSAADLAHAHLERFWARVRSGVDEVLLAVPGSRSERQLGLILGIARACGMPVVGLVDAAVAAGATAERTGPLVHVDLELNAVVVTELDASAAIVRRRVQVGDGAGLIALRDAWVKRISRLFLARTRFDPLHLAATEQSLYDGIPQLLQRLGREPTAGVGIDAAGQRRSVDVERADLIEGTVRELESALHLVRRSRRAGAAAAVLLSHRAAAVPGLGERLGEIGGTEVVELSPSAAAAGALLHADEIRAEGAALPFVTQLKAEVPPGGPDRVAGPPAARGGRPPRHDRPTHVLHAGRAHPISERPLVLGTAVPPDRRGITLRGNTAGVSRVHCSLLKSGELVIVEDHSTHGTFLNDQRVDGTAVLGRGDRLRLGSPGIELQLITVSEDDAPASD